MSRKIKRDIFDEMFDHPELTLAQAYWKVNRKKIILRRLFWVTVVVLISVFIAFRIFS